MYAVSADLPQILESGPQVFDRTMPIGEVRGQRLRLSNPSVSLD